MSRDICGICWCPYDDDGRCGCEPAPLVRNDTSHASDEALLRQALEALEACLGWPEVIEKLKERLK